MANETFSLEVKLDLSPQAAAELQKKIDELQVRKKNLELGIETKDAVSKIQALEKEIDAIKTSASTVPIKLEADTKEVDAATQALQSLEQSLNNVGERSLAIQGMTAQLKQLGAETLTFDGGLKAAAISFNVLAKTDFSGVVQSFKQVGSLLKESVTQAKKAGTEMKAAFNQRSMSGFASGLKQVPSLMKAAAGGAKTFGMAMKSALGTIQLAISSLQAVVGLIQLIPGVGDGIQSLLQKLPKGLQGVVGNLLGVEVAEGMAKLGKVSKVVDGELKQVLAGSRKVTAEWAKILEQQNKDNQRRIDQLKWIERNTEELSKAQKLELLDLEQAIGLRETILSYQEEEVKKEKEIKQSTFDYNQELKKRKEQVAALAQQLEKLRLANSDADQFDIINADSATAIVNIKAAYEAEVEAINKIAELKGDAIKRNALLAEEQRKLELAKDIALEERRKQLQAIIDGSSLAPKKSELQQALAEVDTYYKAQIEQAKDANGVIADADKSALEAQMAERVAITKKEYYDKVVSLANEMQAESDKHLLALVKEEAGAASANYVRISELAREQIGIAQEVISKADFDKAVELKLKITTSEDSLAELRDKMAAAVKQIEESDISSEDKANEIKKLTESYSKNFATLESNIEKAKKAHADFVGSIGQGESKWKKYAITLSEGFRQLGQDLKLVTAEKIEFDSSNFDKQTRELKSKLNDDLITYEEYYDQIVELEKAKNEEIATIEAENAKAQAEAAAENRAALFGGLASTIQSFNETLTADMNAMVEKWSATVAGSQEQIAAHSQATSSIIATGLGTAFQGIFADMAAGELTVGSLFTNMLKGALSVLPALLTVEGIMSPWKLITVAAGVTALIALINGLTNKQKSQGYVEGGLVTGERGRDKIPARLTDGEYVVPADIVRRNLPRLERLRYTGQWSNPALSNTAVLERKIDILTNTIRNTERNVKLVGNVSVNSKYFSDVEWNRLRMSF